jgi:hypothetical protein
MSQLRIQKLALSTAALTIAVVLGNSAYAQRAEPDNGRPNPYRAVEGWAKLPDGRTWGSTAGVDIDPDGTHVWAIDRCGANSCAGSSLDPILKFDSSGRSLAVGDGYA